MSPIILIDQTPGTLLVNGVDQWVLAVAQLKQCLSFLPGWRFDDIMVSYAVAGGGVGPPF